MARVGFHRCGDFTLSGPRLGASRFDKPSGDTLGACLPILMRASTLLNLLDPLRWLCLRFLLGCSSEFCVSVRLDG